MEARRLPWGARGPERSGPGRAPASARSRHTTDRARDAAEGPFGADSALGRILTARAIGIPCPKPLALIRPAGPGWTAEGATPDDAVGWARVLERVPPSIAIRPAERTFGTRLGAFTRAGDELHDQYGTAWTAAELAELLLAARDEEAWVVEARPPDHPMLTRLVEAGPLPAVVAFTLLDGSGVPVLLSADLSVEPPGGPRARRRHGPARDLLRLDPASGRLAGRGPDAFLPAWGAVCALIARCARATPEARAMGWDILVTARGPMLADAWSPLRTGAAARCRHVVAGALEDRSHGHDPLGERLDP